MSVDEAGYAQYKLGTAPSPLSTNDSDQPTDMRAAQKQTESNSTGV